MASLFVRDETPSVLRIDGYVQLTALRCRGPFHLYTARHAQSDAPRLLVVAATRSDLAERCLRALAAAHRLVRGPAFPKLAELMLHAEPPYVAFEVDIVCDGEQLIGRMAQAQTRVRYEEAMAVVQRLGEALAEAHRTCDAQGRPLMFGGLAWGNVLVDRHAQLYLLGLGHNVIVRNERGQLAGVPSFFAPPELLGGGPVLLSADAYAFVLLQRSVLSYCHLPSALRRVFAGESSSAEQPLARVVKWSSERVLGAQPDRRGGIEGLRVRWQREWRLLQLKPDPHALRTTLLRVMDGDGASMVGMQRARPATLLLGPAARWCRMPDGSHQDMTGRGALKRIVQCLVAAHAASQHACSPDVLIAAGWPGERIKRQAGLNRVYVALAMLRKMGLREVLQRDDEGYRLDPTLIVQSEASDNSQLGETDA